MFNKKLIKRGIFGLIGMLAVILPVSGVWAHGGASGVDLDVCRIPVGDQWVHFTAYTPQQSGDKEYCASIPTLGMTNLVFDYEGHKLRKMTVEFEITKEPEGKRVYYQEPKAHKTGSVNAVIDFGKFGAGKYLAHVALVPPEGAKVDAHIPFAVGMGESQFTQKNILIAVLLIGGLGYMFYLSNAGFKEKVDGLLKKAKSA